MIHNQVQDMTSPEPRNRLGRIYLWLSAGFMMILGGVAAYLFLDRELFHGNSERMKKLEQASLTAEVSLEVQQQGQWPEWRGPLRDGIAHESGLLASWPKDGPPQIWQASVGAGYSSIAISDHRAFTLFQDSLDEDVVCWDAATGQEHWWYKYPCQYNDPQGSGPRSTPSVDGDRVYTVGARGMLHCLKATNGDVVWKHDLAEEYHGPMPRWGVSFSPLVYGELVLTNPGGPNGNSLVAFNKLTGHVAWKNLDDPPAYSSPIAATIAGKKQIIF